MVSHNSPLGCFMFLSRPWGGLGLNIWTSTPHFDVPSLIFSSSGCFGRFFFFDFLGDWRRPPGWSVSFETTSLFESLFFRCCFWCFFASFGFKEPSSSPDSTSPSWLVAVSLLCPLRCPSNTPCLLSQSCWTLRVFSFSMYKDNELSPPLLFTEEGEKSLESEKSLNTWSLCRAGMLTLSLWALSCGLGPLSSLWEDESFAYCSRYKLNLLLRCWLRSLA